MIKKYSQTQDPEGMYEILRVHMACPPAKTAVEGGSLVSAVQWGGSTAGEWSVLVVGRPRLAHHWPYTDPKRSCTD